jgi:hypothetical protein
MINFFPILDQNREGNTRLMPHLAQKTIFASGLGFLYGRVFEVSSRLTAQLFGVTELARSILHLLIVKSAPNSVERSTLLAREFIFDFAANTALVALMYRLNLIAQPGLTAFAVFYAAYVAETAFTISRALASPTERGRGQRLDLFGDNETPTPVTQTVVTLTPATPTAETPTAETPTPT